MFGIPSVLLLVDQDLRSTFIDLLSHVFSLHASSATLLLSLRRLAQLLDDGWSEGHPVWAMRMSTDALQYPRVPPIGNGRDSDMQQLGCGKGREASIASLSAQTEARSLRASKGMWETMRIPSTLLAGKRPPIPERHPSSLSLLAIWVAVWVGDHARTRSTTCGLVCRSSHDIVDLGTESAVRASVCQRRATAIIVPRLEGVIFLSNHRRSCFRLTTVVVEACQMAGRSCARRQMYSRCPRHAQ